jgi:hypothetical protein
MKPDLGLAARTLALDLAAGELIRALAAAGIDCLLLKGPAMAHRLYLDAPGCRNYGDIDLLVAPWQFDAACSRSGCWPSSPCSPSPEPGSRVRWSLSTPGTSCSCSRMILRVTGLPGVSSQRPGAHRGR